jgi:hypothetical protein
MRSDLEALESVTGPTPAFRWRSVAAGVVALESLRVQSSGSPNATRFGEFSTGIEAAATRSNSFENPVGTHFPRWEILGIRRQGGDPHQARIDTGERGPSLQPDELKGANRSTGMSTWFPDGI